MSLSTKSLGGRAATDIAAQTDLQAPVAGTMAPAGLAGALALAADEFETLRPGIDAVADLLATGAITENVQTLLGVFRERANAAEQAARAASRRDAHQPEGTQAQPRRGLCRAPAPDAERNAAHLELCRAALRGIACSTLDVTEVMYSLTGDDGPFSRMLEVQMRHIGAAADAALQGTGGGGILDDLREWTLGKSAFERLQSAQGRTSNTQGVTHG